MNHNEDTAGKDPDAYTRAVKVIEDSLLAGQTVRAVDLVWPYAQDIKKTEPDIEKGEFSPLADNLGDSLAAIIVWVTFGIIIGMTLMTLLYAIWEYTD
jgi:hypothetical protein